jgi:HK97 family phage prohead protease
VTTLFRGYAAVWDTPWNEKLTATMGYVERVAHGAFREALASGDNIPLLLEHDSHKLLATTNSGNLRLKEDTFGLRVDAKLPDNYLGVYARSLVESGDLAGMSYGIALDPQQHSTLTRIDGVWTRTITGVRRLLDVSLTWQPAYTSTTARLRPPGSATQVSPTGDIPQHTTELQTRTLSTNTDYVPWWEHMARILETEVI